MRVFFSFFFSLSLFLPLSLPLSLSVSLLFWIFGKVMQEEERKRNKEKKKKRKCFHTLPIYWAHFSMNIFVIMRSFIRNLTKYKCCKIDDKNSWLIRIRLQIICLQLMMCNNHHQINKNNNNKNQQQMIGHGK